MPYQCDNALKIVIPLEGECAERSNNKINTVVSKGKVQLFKYPKGSKLLEYNPDNEIELCYLIFKFTARSKKYSCDIFDMPFENDDFTKILSTPLRNKSEGFLNLYTGSYKREQQVNFQFDGKTHGLFIYVLEGTLKLSSSSQSLQTLEMVILKDHDEIDLLVSDHTKFVVLELINDEGNLCSLD